MWDGITEAGALKNEASKFLFTLFPSPLPLVLHLIICIFSFHLWTEDSMWPKLAVRWSKTMLGQISFKPKSGKILLHVRE